MAQRDDADIPDLLGKGKRKKGDAARPDKAGKKADAVPELKPAGRTTNGHAQPSADPLQGRVKRPDAAGQAKQAEAAATRPGHADSDDIPVPGLMRKDPRADQHRSVPAPTSTRKKGATPSRLPPERSAPNDDVPDLALGKDPLQGTAEGPTPVPDSDRLNKIMERSGAYRQAEATKSPRRQEQERKAEEKEQKKFQERYRELMDTVARSRSELGYDPDRPVTVIPPPPEGHREVERAELVPDRAHVRILLNEKTNGYVYDVVEPALEENEEEILFFLRDTLVRTLDGRRALDKEKSQRVLLDAVRQAIVDHRILIDEVGARRIEYYLLRDFLGYGPIDVMMRDPMLEDISCDGPAIPIYLFHRKYESLRSTVIFHEDISLDSYVIRLAQRSGKHISIADPLLDATLPDGSRLQATLSHEVTTRGSSFTIRRFRADPLTPPDLIKYGTMSPEMAAYFWLVMEHGHSFILAGGTASGKTTSLNAICQFIPPAKKIVSIEDTREINLLHENWIAGVTRSGFGGELIGGKPAGTIDMYKLLEAALRQRPEFLLVGEVRGPEALTLFQAMATGHAVYSTMHADSATSAVYRLENEPINVPRMMLETLDLVLIQGQARTGNKMVRRLREAMEIVGFDPETRELLTNTVFEWDVSSDTHRYLGKSYILEQIMDAQDLTEAQVSAEWQRRVEVLEWMEAEGMRHYTDVSNVIASYYRDPDGFVTEIRKGRPPPLTPLEVADGAT